VEEEERESLAQEITQHEDQIEHLSRKNALVQDKLGSEEDAKRRTLLRYVNAVKASSPNGGGSIQLPGSGITDEEVHAVAALVRGNMAISELNLRDNLITDEGARAMAAVLAGVSSLRTVDLRGNHIGKQVSVISKKLPHENFADFLVRALVYTTCNLDLQRHHFRPHLSADLIRLWSLC